jgi:pyruvate dehydrogenase E1 component
MSTTMAFVRMVGSLLKDPTLGPRVVPIIADEARTFGMADLFRQVGIYAPFGQLYEPEDRDQVSYYKEAVNGQILEEGITEAGAIASWVAAATSYSAHGLPMLPFYIYYSMFGFQRVGDAIWAAADSRSRGFLLGATAGRTTLAGEGLQHQDGTSHLIASTVPNCRAYDPCFAYELAVIVEDGMRRMLGAQEDVFYYVTVMNENYAQPSLPADVRDGILHGLYLVRPSGKGTARVRLLGSGTILREAMAAAELLESEFGVGADVYSVTSYTELRREAMALERSRRLGSGRGTAWVEQLLPANGTPVVAASDYVSALPDLIRPWVRDRMIALGTDGFGRSDTRANLRRFFEVDPRAIALAALSAVDPALASQARSAFGPDDPAPRPPWSS